MFKLKLWLYAVYAMLLSLLGMGRAWAVTQYDTMVAAVTFTDVITALLAVGAVILGVVIVIKGIVWLIGMVRRR